MKNLKLIAILLLGTLLRVYHNTSIALWHDEAFSALYTRDYGWAEMMHRIGLDVHPPLYYILLKLWSYVFGHSLISLRSVSIIFGVLTIWAAYLLVKKISKSSNVALFSALLLTVNPFQIQYAVEARMYTLGTFMALFSSYLLVLALESKKTKHWIWYSVFAVACLYTHYFLFFTVVAQGLYAVYCLIKETGFSWKIFKTQLTKQLAGSGILMLILYIPWIPTFIIQNQRVQESYWIPPMDRWSIPGTIWKMAVGGQGTNKIVLVLSTLIAIILLAYYFKKAKEPSKMFILAGLIIPFLGSILLSLKTAIFLDRYFVFAALFFIIAIASFVIQIQTYAIRRTAAAILVILSLAAFFKNWKDLDIVGKPGMAEASELINDQSTANDKIYVGSSFVYFTFKYYNQTQIEPQLYSSAPLANIPHFSGTALLNEDDLILDFSQTKKNDSVWLIWTTGFGGNKPNTPGNWSKASEDEFEDAPGFKGKIIVTRYHVN